MAAIDLRGNTLVVAGAGTVGLDHIYIRKVTVYCTLTSAALSVTEVGSGVATVLEWQTDQVTTKTHSKNVDFIGRKGRLSFDTVTACTAFFSLA